MCSTEVHNEMDGKAQVFIDEMNARYPDRLKSYSIDTIDQLYAEVYKADCYWSSDEVDDDDDDDDNGNKNGKKNRTRRADDMNELRRLLEDSGRFRRAAVTDEYGNVIVEKPHSILEDIAHAFHKASITILGILFVEVRTCLLYLDRRYNPLRWDQYLVDRHKME